MKNSHIISAALGSLLALGLANPNANAAEKKMGMGMEIEMEKCFGIAKAAVNHCSSRMSAFLRRSFKD